MNCCAEHRLFALSRLSHWVRLLACLALLTAVAACGNHPTHHARTQYNPSRYYPPPGSGEDPWGPYIREASTRYGVPELWVRRVMHQESGGQEDVISWAGAMGLMQVMPDTYDDLKGRYNLGDDAFDPHNNILAGTAYLREMYDRFGAPGFLAAYNAGPNRLDRYLNNGTPLPDETVNYVASIAPLLGTGTAMSGPLAIYAGGATRFATRITPGGCNPDAAYNPDGPCTAAPVQSAAIAAAVPYSHGNCDPDAAYEPNGPCRPRPLPPVQPVVVAAALPYTPVHCDPDAAYDPSRSCQPLTAAAAPVRIPLQAAASATGLVERASRSRPIQEAMGQLVAFNRESPIGHWGVQVGAFANLRSAQIAAENARKAAPDLLRMAKIELPATIPFGTQVAFRARLSGLTPAAAADACARLGRHGIACMTIPPKDGRSDMADVTRRR